MSRVTPSRRPMRVFSKEESICCICNDILWPVIQLKCHITHILCATCWERIVENTRADVTTTTSATGTAPTHLRFDNSDETDSDDSGFSSDAAPENYHLRYNVVTEITARCPFCNTYTEAIILRNARLTMKCGDKTMNPDKHDRLCNTCDTTKASKLNAMCTMLTCQLETATTKNTKLMKKLAKCSAKYDKELEKIDFLSDEIIRLTCTDHGIISKRVYDMLNDSNLLIEHATYSASSDEDSSDSDTP